MIGKYCKKIFSLLFLGNLCLTSVMSPTPIQAQIETSEEIVEVDSLASPTGTANCYISSFGIRQTKDGTESFDKNDEIGNDSSDSNRIVRSFDYINYDLEYVTAISDPSQVVNSAYVDIEFVLPMDPSKAVFNMDTLKWCENAKTTYVYEDGSQSTTWDQSKKVIQQVLTGKRKITNNADINAIPGVGTLSFGVYVKAASNQDIVQPTFRCWIEGDSRVQECQSEPIAVSAEPRYDLVLNHSNTGNFSDPLVYISPDRMEYTADDIEGYSKGRLEGFTMMLELYNSDTSKGLKGIELPQGDITFTVSIKETLNGADVTGTSGYTPFLWEYGLNIPGDNHVGLQGKPMTIYGDPYTSGFYSIPYGRNNHFKRTWNSTWDSGDYTVTDNGDFTFDVTIKDYSFDVDQYYFPTGHIHGRSDSITFPENVGIFSIGFMQFLCEFPRGVSETSNILFTTEVTNFHATSSSNKEVTTEVRTNNNKVSRQITLYPPGSYSSRNVFSPTSVYGAGDFSAGKGESLPNGNRALGQSVSYFGDEPLRAINFFQKFDDKNIELQEDINHWNQKANTYNKEGDITVLYGAKPDKTGWKNDEEQNKATEENLIYFKSLKELEEKGYTCVAVLFEFRNGEYYSKDGMISNSLRIKIKDDAEVGTVAMVKPDSRAWKGKEKVMSWTEVPYKNVDGAYGLGSSETDWGGKKKYVEGYRTPTFDFHRNYEKTTYEKGTVSGGHTGGYLAGNSVLILGDKTTIKASTKKTTYDVDNNERTAEFKLTPVLTFASSNKDTAIDMTDNVYIEASLPKELEYVLDSASIKPDKVEKKDDGTTTLYWTLKNQKVGDSMPAISFKTKIGQAGTKEDVQNMQQIKISAKISSDMDNRVQSAMNSNYSEATIQIIKLATSSISKSVDKELQDTGGEFTYSLNVGNTSEIELLNARLYDVLPFNGDSRGSNFHGKYRITGVEFDFSDAPETLKENESNAFLSYTKSTNVQTEDKQETILNGQFDDTWNKVTKCTKDGTSLRFNINQQDITAMYFDIGGNLKGKEFITIRITCTPLNDKNNFLKDENGTTQKAGDVYINSFYQYADQQIAIVQSNIAKTTVVNRKVSGIVWLDANKNGIQDTNETKLENKPIQIYRLNPSQWDANQEPITIDGKKVYKAYTTNGEVVNSITTDDKGFYEFSELEAGEYIIALTNIQAYTITDKDQGEDDTKDNDSQAGDMSEDKTLSAVISEIQLPEAKDMTAVTYRSENHDFGLYRTTYAPVELVKEWQDDNNRDGKRPEEVTIVVKGDDLTKEISLKSGDNWENTVNGLPKYKENGDAIIYSFKEKTIDGYSGESSGDMSKGFTFTNTHEIETIDISVQKQWNDAENQDGQRPKEVKVQLLEDGKETNQYVVLNEDNQWKGSFSNLAKYKDAGTEIQYTVQEVDLHKEYTGKIQETSKYDFTITNTYIPKKTEIKVKKEWNDDDNRDGVRPESVEVQLIKDGKAVEDKIITLNESNHWEDSFTDLDKYENKGKEIQYEVQEINTSAQYKAKVEEQEKNQFVITNMHSIETINIPVTKKWDDDNNRDNVRPKEVKIQLYANGKVVENKTINLTSENNWQASFTNLPKYENHGKEIQYSVKEINVDKAYTSNVTKENNGFVITNRHIPDTIKLSVEKVWDDNNDQDGKRPDSVEVGLYAQDKLHTKVVLSNKNQWCYTFTDLLKNEAGAPIQYEIKELSDVKKYTSTITNENSSWIITNHHEVEKTKIEGKKVWEDDNNRDGLRPEEVTIILYANGEEVERTTTNEEQNWEYSFSDLDVYKNGQKITYAVEEIPVEGYSVNEKGYVFTNVHEPGKTSVNVRKVWDDKENQDGIRPESITVHLLADEKDTGKELILSEENHWQGTFTDLFEKENGKDITYTVTEDAVEGYTTSIEKNENDVFVITNAYQPKTIEKTIEKTWDDADNQDGLRPDTVTAMLYKNGEIYEEVQLSEENEWKYVFQNLPMFEHGKEIVWTVDEKEIEGYEKTIQEVETGFIIQNKHIPEKVNLKITKQWDDADNQDKLRPDTIQIALYADEEILQNIEITEQEQWTKTINDLDKYRNGQEIAYEIQEELLDGYTTKIEEIKENEWVVTNTHIVQKVEPVKENSNKEKPTKPEEKRKDSVSTGLGGPIQWVFGFTVCLVVIGIVSFVLKRKIE